MRHAVVEGNRQAKIVGESPFNQSETKQATQTHAVVIGASLTGLMTARVLSDYVSHVTLIERDALPSTPDARNGVPQSHQYHGLMAKGYQIMQSLYPQLEAELIADGIPMPDSLSDFVVFAPNGAGYLPRYQSNIFVPTCSRHRLEWHIRRLTLAIPNITAVPHTEVVSLIPAQDQKAVAGVTIRYRQQAVKSGIEQLAADWVCDCSGRHSKIEQWLTQLNWALPPVELQETAVRYSTRLFHMPENWHTIDSNNWSGLLVTMQYPQNPRFGGLRQIEDGLWQVALAGLNGHVPPDDDSGFLAYANALASPIIFEAIQNAKPATPIHAYFNKKIHRRAIDKSRGFPENLLVLGDANTCYNPLYGQGMTSSAVMVNALHQVLIEQHGRLHSSVVGAASAKTIRIHIPSKTVHKKIARATNNLWRQANQLDSLWANPNPEAWTIKQRLMNKISRESLPLLAEDEALFIRGTEVRHMLRPVWQGVNGRFLFKLLIKLMQNSRD